MDGKNTEIYNHANFRDGALNGISINPLGSIGDVMHPSHLLGRKHPSLDRVKQIFMFSHCF